MRQKVIVGYLFVILLLLSCNISSPSPKVLTTTTSENSTQEITPPTGDENPLATDRSNHICTSLEHSRAHPAIRSEVCRRHSPARGRRPPNKLLPMAGTP